MKKISNRKENSNTTCICMIPYFFERKEYNISDICYYAEISRQSFYNYLDNKQLPSVHTARLICNYFEDIAKEKFSIEDLWKITERPEEISKKPEYFEEGTDEDFDRYAVEVMNGDGYYNSEGKFVRYRTEAWYDEY